MPLALGSLLRERPVVRLLLGFRSHPSIPFLNSSGQLILLAGERFPVAISEFAPALAR